MSLVKDAIRSLVEEGKITHEFTLNKIKFEMELLSTEEQILAEGLIDPERLKKKYGASDQINTFQDTMRKYRSLAQMAFSIKKVNGTSPVDLKTTLEEQFKQRIEFRDELAELGTAAFDELVANYNILLGKQKEFFKDVKENVGK